MCVRRLGKQWLPQKVPECINWAYTWRNKLKRQTRDWHYLSAVCCNKRLPFRWVCQLHHYFSVFFLLVNAPESQVSCPTKNKGNSCDCWFNITLSQLGPLHLPKTTQCLKIKTHNFKNEQIQQRTCKLFLWNTSFFKHISLTTYIFTSHLQVFIFH